MYWGLYAGCSECTGDYTLVVADVLGIMCWLQQMYWGWKEFSGIWHLSLLWASSFTALQHSCIIYCCLLGGMCVHFKFPRLACMPNLYCISCVFGDWPLGDLYIRYSACWRSVDRCADWICVGDVSLGRLFWGASPSLLFFSVFSLPYSRPWVVFSPDFGWISVIYKTCWLLC